jgi:hypothetical protein
MLVVLLSALAISNGVESRKNPPSYPGQAFFSIIFAMGAIILVVYKMRTA